MNVPGSGAMLQQYVYRLNGEQIIAVGGGANDCGTGAYAPGDVVTYAGGILAANESPAQLTIDTVSNGIVVTAHVTSAGGYKTPMSTGATGCPTWDPTNPITAASDIVLSNGNLSATVTLGSSREHVVASAFGCGRMYSEYTVTGFVSGLIDIGMIDPTASIPTLIGSPRGYGYLNSGRAFGEQSGNNLYGAAYTTGDVISVLYNATAATMSFLKNGVDQGVAFTAMVSANAPAMTLDTDAAVTANFGATPFIYTPPAGYAGWCTGGSIATTGGSGTGFRVIPNLAPVVIWISSGNYHPPAPWLVD